MRRRIAALAASSLVLSGCGFHGLYSVALPGGADVGAHPMTITVNFADVLDLVPQSAVKVNDVSVGRVVSIKLAAPDAYTATVKLLVRGDVALPSNARAELGQTSLLGEKYVELEAPAEPASTPLKSGDSIPLSRTGRNPEVEEVLGALSLLLNGGGLQQIRIIAHELNQALGGNQGQIRDLLTQLTTFVGTLDRQKTQITNAVTQLDVLAGTLNRQKAVLLNTLSTLPGALKVLADERSQLVTLLTTVSAFGAKATGVITSTTGTVTSTLTHLRPVIDNLAAAGQNLPDSLELLTTFPFPRNTVSIIGGDYVNLDAQISVDLTTLLGNLSAPTVASASQRPLAGSSLPLIPGLSR